ncbi:nuclear transport factor 2 family protein [Geodermatophilus marinus]|uniref:nuclear transport factor 2 family protein n=1 Tax=Geodermatophilus sp. LHW52908 TaxID=2303986 RepID=UPI000E3D6085|nr:nuclear transport factor 2 family protein [Geodermatophilus sp. LHW52908]RFU20517.1 nuclear transport factor 2 family protein [Geodermatophilus sp. LHW52908]
MSADLAGRLARLEQRVQQLEDERAVARVIAAYGPLVDGGDAARVAALWASDGVYDVDELLMTGPAEIAAMVRSPAHQRWIAGGCAHLVGPPHVTVTGDDAIAVCHSLMVVHDNGRFVVRRATANRWRLRRGAGGWQVVDRTNRVLDGREEAPHLLTGGIPGADVPGHSPGVEP